MAFMEGEVSRVIDGNILEVGGFYAGIIINTVDGVCLNGHSGACSD